MAQSEQVGIVPLQDVSDSISGATIYEIYTTPEGAHLSLHDGRVLVFIGEFIVGVGRFEKQYLQ